MSTRCMVSFLEWDGSDKHHVYKHSDGYPEGPGLLKTLIQAGRFAWKFPRYEPDEFACAFITVSKAHAFMDVIGQVDLELVAREQRYNNAGSQSDGYERAEAYGGPEHPWQTSLILPSYFYAENQNLNGGGVRLMGSNCDWKDVAPGDLQYRYEVTCHPERSCNDEPWIRVWSISQEWQGPREGEWNEEHTFEGKLSLGLAYFDKLKADEDEAERIAAAPPARVRTRGRQLTFTE